MGGSGSNRSPASDQYSDLRSLSDETPFQARRHVLIVEDNESDVFLIQRALEATKLQLAFHVAKDGEQATLFFDQADSNEQPSPDVVILDINLPKKQGGDVLVHLRKSARCSKTHVIVVTTLDLSRDRERMLQLGADGYFRKPSEFDEFMKLGALVKAVLEDAQQN